MAFPAREITTRLVDGEVILRPREMNGRNEPQGTIVRMLESCLTGTKLFSVSLRKTTPLRVSLRDKLTLHNKMLKFYHMQSLPCKGREKCANEIRGMGRRGDGKIKRSGGFFPT